MLVKPLLNSFEAEIALGLLYVVGGRKLQWLIQIATIMDCVANCNDG